MPIVKSYYRRSPGMASATATERRHNLRVVVYDGPSSSTPVRFRGRHQISALQFSTQLPGGFGQCAFVVTGAAARQWEIDTGYKVIVWDGRRVVWMGWVEDMVREANDVSVVGLGPWQTLAQRQIPSATYYSWHATDAALKAMLLTYGTFISEDHSEILWTGMDIGDLEIEYWSVAELIDVLCKAGNIAGLPMLFALWEPDQFRSDVSIDDLTGYNILYNGDVEIEDPTDPGNPTYWDLSLDGSWDTTIYHSARHSMQLELLNGNSNTVYSPSSGGTSACVQKTAYRLNYWAHFEDLNMKCQASISWYNVSSVLISTSTGKEFTADAADTWTNYVESYTSPEGAVYYRLEILCTNNSGGTASVYLDDVYLYKIAERGALNLAVPYFWPRDLSDYDYVLRRLPEMSVTESTRMLTNAVVAKYGASYTAVAENAASQTAYRRRDHVVVAGNEASADLAETMRDIHLARYKDPLTEIDRPWRLDRVSSVLVDKLGRPARLSTVRAGERVRIADGQYSGSVVMIDKTDWRNGELTITMERYADTAEILARSL